MPMIINKINVFILVVHLCLRETYKSMLGKFFCLGVRDIMLSLCGLQLACVVYFLPISAHTN